MIERNGIGESHRRKRMDGKTIASAWTPGDFLTPRILADWEDENGNHLSAMLLRLGAGMVMDDGGYDGGYGGDGYDGGGYDGGYDGGYGYGYDGGGGGYGGYGEYLLSKGFSMDNGLHIICSPGGYYPYVRVGWCVREDGFIWMYNCRLVKRFGTNAELAKIAEEGPISNTQLLSMAEKESVSVAMISRAIPCNPAAWRKECPKPKEMLVERA
jgi:hypothetical protein